MLTKAELHAIATRQQVAMAFIQTENESIEATACQGVLIGHDVPLLLAEIVRLQAATRPAAEAEASPLAEQEQR